MRSSVHALPLTTPAEWDELRGAFTPTDSAAYHLNGTFDVLEEMGARYALLEEAYIDRDFSAAHSKFYASLFQPCLKYCQRLHFFRESFDPDALSKSALARQTFVQEQQPHYLGFVVIRPLTHAPVSWGVLSARHLPDTAMRVPIQGRYYCHFLGAQLYVDGAPATEQDRRVGACAQAAAWTIARHSHIRHRGPWYSVPAITELAITSVDHWVSRGLPAGSDALSLDGMLRALRAMGRHPMVVGSKIPGPSPEWSTKPRDVIWQYLDSQIPVIVGLRRDTGIGHAVVAVGTRQGELTSELGIEPRLSDGVHHFLVQDDQRGSYQPLYLSVSDKEQAESRPIKPDEWTLADCQYLVIPMPEKVFLTGEDAEQLARDLLADMTANRAQMLASVSEKIDPPQDSAFVKAVAGNRLVARTYLSHGWSYQARAISNKLPDNLKEEIAQLQFPRFVWVTEFFLPSACRGANLADDSVIAHVVTDATGSPLWDSWLVADVPGLSIVWTFDPSNPTSSANAVIFGNGRSTGYEPKRSGNVT